MFYSRLLVKKPFKQFIYWLLLGNLLLSSSAFATVQSHAFSLIGDGGETGSGTFTWEDTTVADGNPLGFVNVLSLSFTVTGGNVVGGSTTFTLTQCSDANLFNTPDFAADMGFNCNDGAGNTLSPADPFNGNLNGGASTLIFTPGATTPVPALPALPVPALSQWGMLLLIILMYLGALLKARRYR
jgi:hypothetical protein